MDGPGAVGRAARGVSTLSVCLDQFRSTAFRLETLPSYAVSGETALRSLRDNGYLARLARSTLAGRVWSRVRIVDDPLTGYQREQVRRVYVESHACGEDVWLFPRAEFTHGRDDFWLFDGGLPGACAVRLCFDGAGAPVRDELVTDRGLLDALHADAVDLLGRAIPLGEFLAAVDA